MCTQAGPDTHVNKKKIQKYIFQECPVVMKEKEFVEKTIGYLNFFKNSKSSLL
jgi:hypothetical protein